MEEPRFKLKDPCDNLATLFTGDAVVVNPPKLRPARKVKPSRSRDFLLLVSLFALSRFLNSSIFNDFGRDRFFQKNPFPIA